MDMGTLLFNYGAVILEFLFEFGVFLALFTARLERKPGFFRRVLLFVPAALGAALPAAALYTLVGGTIPGRIAVYLLLFLSVYAGSFYLFAESAWTLLFCASAAYAAQNLTYKLYLTQYLFGRFFGIYNTLSPVVYRLMYYGVFFLCVFALNRLYIRKVREKLAVDKLNEKVFSQALIILLASVILCSANDILFERAGVSVDGLREPSLMFALRQLDNALSIVCGVAVLLFLGKTVEQQDLQRELEQLRYAIRQSEQQYRISKETVDMINIKCHDMKYKLDAAINGSGLSADTFADLRNSIRIYDCNIETGNRLLNTLFFEKSLYCESRGIRLTCMIDGERLGFMSDGDLYCLFGNLVDNALEAVSKLEDPEKRVINVVVKARGNLVLAEEENYFMGGLDLREGLPVTSKEDKAYHGFGLMSMRTIARKYGGEMSIQVREDVFRLSFLFPGEGAEETPVNP